MRSTATIAVTATVIFCGEPCMPPSKQEETESPKRKKRKTEEENTTEGSRGKDGGKGNKVFDCFVRGLPFSATEATVKKDFEECGEIVSVNVPLNDEGNAHGVACINFKDAASIRIVAGITG